MYTSPLNFVCGLMLPGFASTCPRSTSSFSTPRSSTPMLSPAWPASSSLRNISTPVTTFFSVGLNPTISISSPTFTRPRSTRPVTTVPRPGIVDGVDLVEGDDHVWHVDLLREQHVLARLRHRTVDGADHENGAVHLRGAGNHVLDVVGVAGAVDMRVVPLGRRVLDMARRD